MLNEPHNRLTVERDQNAISARAGKEPTAMRVTVRYGLQRRVFVLEHPPFPKKGDVLTVEGEGAEWTVVRVKPTKVVLRSVIRGGKYVPDVR